MLTAEYLSTRHYKVEGGLDMKGEGARRQNTSSLLFAAVEVGIFTAIFAVAGAWPAPDVNEGYYLAKARHSFNPEWCGNDFFLNSGEAHGLFFYLLGPLAASVTLSTAAWVGRWVGWLVLAVGFRHAVFSLLPSRMHRLFAGVVFSLAARYTTMAGEWLIGGCEAKVFAWALVLAAWGEAVRGRWAFAWLLSGVATAFHPLVGGWMMILIGLIVISQFMRNQTRISSFKPLVLGCVIGGVCLASIGLWPASQISIGVSAEVRNQAAAVYVVDRLSHHLLPRSFQEVLVARHLLAIMLCGCLYAALPYETKRTRGLVLVLAAVLLSFVGFVMGLFEPFAPALVYGMLRFYWFRLADGLVPLGLCVLLTQFLLSAQLLESKAQQTLRQTCLIALALTFFMYDSFVQSKHWPLLTDKCSPRGDKLIDAASWEDVCQWIQKETSPSDCFLTPRGASSFLWRAQRPEVVAWKNVPQDPVSILEWRQRIIDCFSYDGTIKNMARSTCSLGVSRLNRVADAYDAHFVLAPQKSFLAMTHPPKVAYKNTHYVVIKLPVEEQQVNDESSGVATN